jgi:hypothetical protein
MDLSLNYHELAQACVGGADDDVEQAFLTLAGGRPTPEASRRWAHMTPKNKRKYVIERVWQLPIDRQCFELIR